MLFYELPLKEALLKGDLHLLLSSEVVCGHGEFHFLIISEEAAPDFVDFVVFWSVLKEHLKLL